MLFWELFLANAAVIVGTVLVGQCVAWIVERRQR
jgi:hypothetical protein